MHHLLEHINQDIRKGKDSTVNNNREISNKFFVTVGDSYIPDINDFFALIFSTIGV